MASPQRKNVAVGRPYFVARTTEFKQVGDPDDRTFQFLASDASVDRMGDTIAVEGWDCTNFKRNPVILFAHHQDLMPVGQATKVWADDKGLHVQLVLDGITQMDKDLEAKLRKGTIRAVSVGFVPRELEWSDERADEEASMGIDFKRQELLELSIVPVPANANALAEARTKAMSTRATKSDGDGSDAIDKCVKEFGEHNKALEGHTKTFEKHLKAMGDALESDDATNGGKSFAEAIEAIGLSPEHKAAVLKAAEQSHAMHPDVAKCVNKAHQALCKAIDLHNKATTAKPADEPDDDDDSDADDDDKKALEALAAKQAEIDAQFTKLTGRLPA